MVKCLRTLPHERPTEEDPSVKELPFHPQCSSIFIFSFHWLQSHHILSSISCSKWRPHFPASVPAGCGYVIKFWVAAHTSRCWICHFLLPACSIVDVRTLRAAETLPLPR